MNKKILMGLTAIALVLGVSNTAKAECDGIYLGVRGVYTMPDAGNSKSSGFDVADDGWGIGAALGYRYEYFRAEIEGMWRNNFDQKINGIVPSKQHLDVNTYMFNVYWDLLPYSMFTPFLMGGVGVADMDYKDEIQGAAPFNESSTNFAWAVGGGLSAKVTSRFNVDVGYRYFDFGNVNDVDITANEIFAGVRYVF